MLSVGNPGRKGIELTIYVLIILGLPFVLLRYGLDYTDSAYHYMAYTGLRNVGSLTYMYAVLGHLWQSIAGDSVLSYRICVYVIYLFSASSTVFFFGRGITMLDKFRYIAFAMILASSVSYNMLNWDAFGILFMSCLFICTNRYIMKNRISSLLMMAFLISIISAIRFPSAVVVFPVCLVIFAAHKLHKYPRRVFLIRIILFLLATISFYSLLRLVLYNGSIAGSFMKTTSSAVIAEPSHLNTLSEIVRLAKLFPRYLSQGWEIVEVLCFLGFLFVAWEWVQNRNKLGRYLVVMLLISYLMFKTMFTQYNLNMSHFYSAFTIFIVGSLFYKSLGMADYKTVVVSIFSIMLGLSSVFGSNTGLLKLSYPFVFILPSTLIKLSGLVKNDHKTLLNLLLIIITIFSLLNILGSKTYEDRRIFRLTSTVRHPKLKYVRTSEIRKQNIEEILYEVDKLTLQDKQPHVWFYGTHSYLFSYLTSTPQPYQTPFNMQFDNAMQAEVFEKQLKDTSDQTAIVLVYDYPENNPSLGENMITDKLRALSYSLIKAGKNYQIYQMP